MISPFIAQVLSCHERGVKVFKQSMWYYDNNANEYIIMRTTKN